MLSYSLPENPGVYLFLDQKGDILYVGKAKNLKKRVASYFSQKIDFGEKTKALLSKVKKVKFVQTRCEIESLLLEANYIKKYHPPYNVRLTDGKAYPLIKITVKDKYPKVLVVRRIEENPSAGGSLYFGPYPNTGSMRLVLRTIRKIFPFQSVNNHPKKACLYHHLGLCPCPPVFDSPALKRNYKKNINWIIKFLNGKIDNVVIELEKEREILSKLEKFEEAKDLQKKIEAIRLITNPVYQPFEYETNPNLKADLTAKDLEDLKLELLKIGIKVWSLHRIECYDVSNIMGKLSTGSMIVFVEGEADKSLYRRFRIMYKRIIPNDVAMIKEIISRRLRHKEWKFPNLILVDGGKAQVSAALKAIKESGLTIPVIGLAKREEAIIVPGFPHFKEIRLPKDSKALHLLQRVRDQTHRFAISYHRKLRSQLLKG